MIIQIKRNSELYEQELSPDNFLNFRFLANPKIQAGWNAINSARATQLGDRNQDTQYNASPLGIPFVPVNQMRGDGNGGATAVDPTPIKTSKTTSPLLDETSISFFKTANGF